MHYVIVNISCFLIFFLLYLVKRNFFPGEVIFYEGVMFVFYIGIFIQALLYFLRIKVAILSASLAFILFTSLVPTILDRSVSITVLTALDSCDKCHLENINHIFNKIYIDENKAIKKRLLEQIYSKNVELSEEKYSFTERGEKVYSLIIFFTKLLKIDNSYLSKSRWKNLKK